MMLRLSPLRSRLVFYQVRNGNALVGGTLAHQPQGVQLAGYWVAP
jgi:hypothetical protein